MANKTQTIRIESILGGKSPMTYGGASNQFERADCIDPLLPPHDSETENTTVASGVIRTTPVSNIGSLGGQPMWMSGARGTTAIFVYCSNGSVYTVSQEPSDGSITALSDGGTLTDSNGDGMAYYDNYIYFAKRTDVARYGPLDGTPVFTGSYWVTTLGLTALSDISYPTLLVQGTTFSGVPNHPMLRHSDGRLYVADVVDNKGTLHYIKTTKTTIEGDTNDGSKYNAVQFGYGLIPTCLESYGSQVVVALYERDGTGNASGRGPTTRAKLAFWDTTSDNPNLITWCEFPDSIITAIKNINGVLYVFSSVVEGARGFRVSRYVGGYSFEEIYSSNIGTSPFPGAVDGNSERLYFGSHTVYSSTIYGSVHGLSLQGITSGGLFTPQISTSTGVATTALTLGNSTYEKASSGFDLPIFAWTDGNATHGVDYSYATNDRYGNSPSRYVSTPFSVGQPFKITKIRVPVGAYITSGFLITIQIVKDSGYSSQTFTISGTDSRYIGKFNAVVRPNAFVGDNNFQIEVDNYSTASQFQRVLLPITIEYELIDD